MQLQGIVLDEQRQFATKFDPWHGETSGRGKIIFAEKCQVESQQWWNEHGGNVRVFVQCTHPRAKYNYPPCAATSKIHHVRVDPRSSTYRQRELDQALPKIQEALLAGRDVIFHCNQSFHRAPVIAAAAYRRMTGGNAAVHTCCMTAVVAATSQTKCFLVWFYYVFHSESYVWYTYSLFVFFS